MLMAIVFAMGTQIAGNQRAFETAHFMPFASSK